jgi:hypothetical protein
MHRAAAALLLVLAGSALAAPAPPRPCADAPGYGDFDFWVGTWAVHTADGELAGHNRIEKAEGGCRVDEHWRGAGGGSGSSINFLDPVDGGWEQVWHSPGGAFIRIRGGLVADAAADPAHGRSMVLEGTIHYAGRDLAAPFRGRWTPLADGRVRQFFEQYDTEADAWKPWFEGFYSRIDDDRPDAGDDA